jgi:hypothetical protein
MSIKKKSAIDEYTEYYNRMNKEEKINFAMGILACSMIIGNIYKQLTKKDVN